MEFLSIFIPKFLFRISWSFFDGSESKAALLARYLYIKKYSNKSGINIFIGKGVTIKSVELLTIGSNVSIHAGTYIDAAGEVKIGSNVSIANQTSIISFEHTWEETRVPIKYNKVITDRIVIENDVWIGAGCRILSGTTLGSRSIVAAGAVVNKNVQSNTIVGGIPAKKIKDI